MACLGEVMTDWQQRNYHGQVVWHISSDTKCNGDEWGNEWMCGLSIFIEENQFEIYEDDGLGNGSHVISHDGTLEEAKQYCENLLVS